MKRIFTGSICLVFCGITAWVVFHSLTGKFSEEKINPASSRVEEERGEKKEGIKGAAKWLEKRLADPETGKIDYNEILRVRQLVAQKINSANTRAASLNLKWEQLGPDNVGGRTRAILIDRNNPSRMYAGSVSGGLFVSDNGGLSWYPHPSFEEFKTHQSISSLAQASNGDIYAGTGEIYIYTEANTLGHLGEGIYKSSDNGQTFRLLPSTKPLPNSGVETWAYVSEVAVDPNNFLKVYAASYKGLMVSNDSGFSWTLAQGTPQFTSREVLVGADGVVHAAVGNSTGLSSSNEQYYRSDDGVSFQLVSGTNGFPETNTRRIEFAISPDDANYVYSLIVRYAQGDKLRGIYRSKDAGKNWEVYSPENSDVFNPLGTQGDYDACIAVVPGEKDKVWVGGQLQLYAGGNDVGWKLIAYWAPRSPSNPYYVHADMHEIVFHPTNSNIAFVGCDGGIFKSESARSENPAFTERNKGYITTQFYNISASPSGEMLGGAQDNGTSYIDFEGNTRLTADLVRGGDGGYTAFSKINPQAFFTEIQEGAIYRSSNAGESWSCWWDQFAKGLNNTDCRPEGGSEFIAPFILWEADDSTEKAFFLFGGNARIYLSPGPLDFSNQPKFYRVNVPGGFVSAIEKTRQGIFYVGLGGGNIFRLDGVLTASYATNNIVTGITVTQIATSATWGGGGRYVAGIAADHNDPGHIIVTLAHYGKTNYVYESTGADEAGTTFNLIQGDLPPMPVYSAVIDYYNNSNIIIGTDIGMWSTSNGGQNWFPEFDGMNPAPVFTVLQEMLYDEGCRVLYAGTYGRGMFRTTTLLEANRGQSCNKVASAGLPENITEFCLYPNPVVNQSILEISILEKNKVQVQVVDLFGRMVKTFDSGWMEPGRKQFEMDFTGVERGVYFVNVKAGNSLVTKQVFVTK